MSDPFTERLTEIADGLSRSMSCVEDFRAKTSASPGKAEGSPETDQGCGGSLPGSFAAFDPDTWSWRTFQLSFIGDSTLSSDGLPRTGMMRSGRLYPQRRWVPRTLESDCSWWPTPRANDPKKRGDFDAHNKRNGLPAAVKRTPNHFPTPTAADSDRMSERYPRGNMTLRGAVIQWPTPQESDATRGPDYARSSRDGSGGDDCTTAVCKEEGESGTLNPTWVAWLMGFPLGWTACKGSETP